MFAEATDDYDDLLIMTGRRCVKSGGVEPGGASRCVEPGAPASL